MKVLAAEQKVLAAEQKVLVAEHLRREGAVLLDVREQNEWAAGRHSKALRIPLGQVHTRARRALAPRRPY